MSQIAIFPWCTIINVIVLENVALILKENLGFYIKRVSFAFPNVEVTTDHCDTNSIKISS